MSIVNVIGAATIDILISNVDKDRFFSGKYKVNSIKNSFGGDALNEVSILNKYNVDTKLISIVGNDQNGYLIKKYLDDHNIKYQNNLIKDNIETSVSLVLIEEDGNRSFVGNINGSVRLLDIDDIHIDEDAKIVGLASMFISQNLTNEKLEILFKSLKDKNITTYVDFSNPKNNESINDLSFLKYIDYMFINRHEASLICNNNDLLECEKILKSSGCKKVIIKCDKDGYLYDSELNNPIGDSCIDSTGAGDSFVAGFVYGLVNNQDVQNCLKSANKFAYKACKYIGATTWLEYEE